MKNIPPTLESYMYDSFQAYDIDKNGALNPDEFFELLVTLNLGLTESDIEQLKVNCR